ncbi:Transposase IS4 [Popillia japonica]|uniref:Transposase IS4 n=1 Tax=Popillia japonica TaxID=7064 RepID=A0AAW1I8I0_POPJA
MAEYGIRFERGFSLHEALAMLEEGDELVENVDSVTIFPPNNACADQTDEDSGEEDSTNLNNLPGTQLQAPAEINLRNIDDQDPKLDMIVNESNRYANQKNHHTKIEKSEIKAFIGVLLLSGYMHVPRRRMFWEYERDSHNLLVSEAISRNTFEYVLSHFHLTDNTKIETSDKFAKGQRDLDMSTGSSRTKARPQILAQNIADMVYQGASTNISTKYSGYGVGPAVVLEYADVLKKKWPNVQMHLFFDNFFSTLPLLELLSNNNLRGTGTIRENRIPASPLMDSKRMKKQPRGSYDYRKVDGENIIVVKWHDNSIVTVCSNSAGVNPVQVDGENIIVVKWHDNSIVTVCSNSAGVNPVHSVKRFSQKEKKNNSGNTATFNQFI